MHFSSDKHVITSASESALGWLILARRRLLGAGLVGYKTRGRKAEDLSTVVPTVHGTSFRGLIIEAVVIVFVILL